MRTLSNFFPRKKSKPAGPVRASGRIARGPSRTNAINTIYLITLSSLNASRLKFVIISSCRQDLRMVFVYNRRTLRPLNDALSLYRNVSTGCFWCVWNLQVVCCSTVHLRAHVPCDSVCIRPPDIVLALCYL